MQISDAVEVIEVHGHEAANEKLVVGWTLLAVLPAKNPSHGGAYGVYVLGKSTITTQTAQEEPGKKGFFDGNWVSGEDKG